MSSVLFGYRIKNGKAVLDPQDGEKVKNLFRNYLDGLSLQKAAEKAGIVKYAGAVKKLLQNRRYLGDDFYPAVVDAETFDAVQKMIHDRAVKMNRLHKKRKKRNLKIPTDFSFRTISEHHTDPLEQAEYLYSLLKGKWH